MFTLEEIKEVMLTTSSAEGFRRDMGKNPDPLMFMQMTVIDTAFTLEVLRKLEKIKDKKIQDLEKLL